MTRWLSSTLLSILTAAIAVGCGQPRPEEPLPSIEEAKRTVAEFEKSELAIPPRTIVDVLHLLDTAPDNNAARRSTMLTTAEADLPDERDLHAYITHLYERAIAARRLGRNGQELADLQRAVATLDTREQELEFPLTVSFKNSLLRDAAWAEFYDGNSGRAVELFQRAVADYEDYQGLGEHYWHRDRWISLSGLSYVQAYSGNLEMGNATAETAREYMEKDVSLAQVNRGPWHAMGPINPWRTIYGNFIDYSLLQAQGRWAEAEPPIRDTITVYETKIAPFPGAWSHGREVEWLPLQRAELATNLMRQGRLLEAEVIIRAGLADSLRERGNLAKTTAVMLDRYVGLLIAKGRY